METLLAILDNPRSSPAVLLRTAMFILSRPQTPDKGWRLPESVPQPGGSTINDSATLEAECSRLADLGDLAPEPPTEPTPPRPMPQNAAQCNTKREMWRTRPSLRSALQRAFSPRSVPQAVLEPSSAYTSSTPWMASEPI